MNNLRDQIINYLTDGKYSRLLVEYLQKHCDQHATPNVVVATIDEFLIVHNFDGIIGALDPTASIKDILADFMNIVQPTIYAADKFIERIYLI